MATTKRSRLVEIFLLEHRTFMQELAALLEDVRHGSLARAQERADEIDKLAGPHIEFEEEVLYPDVGRRVDRQLEHELRDEHAVARNALARLLSADLAVEDHAKLRRELQPSLETAVAHADHCGTLLSSMATWPKDQQAAAEQRLSEIHAQRHRWTELVRQPRATANERMIGGV